MIPPKKELTEKEILEFWKKNKIYEKSKTQNKKGKKFYFMDGPPYATGHIHMGTALNKILKDIAMRSQRLQGKDVFDRAGYDTHGVPIEFKIEKEIGAKTKQDIEKYGVKKFIDKCKEFATQYIDVMNAEFENLGVWMDFKKPYLTLDEKYIETIWDTFKVADKKGLLYLGKYPIHICPRCETAVAFNEIEYSKQDDTSIFVKFPLKNKKNTFLIIWTTTPWTLPANTGVMVHPDIEYQELEISSGEKWIIAKALAPKIMAQLEMGFTVREEFKGKHMEGWEYTNPLSKNLKLKTKNAYKVVTSSRYVTTEDGTGLVHTAPGHGKEDYEVGKKFNLDMPSPVNISGHLTEEAGKYEGKKARFVDEEIIKDLEEDNAIVYKMKYTHDYPMCWRCRSPLLMVSLPQWFLRISEIQKQILQENEETTWNPSWMKMRMKAWLEGISDWPVSRKRYWGTPLPIWVCDNEDCNEKIVIGSKKELEKLSKKKVKDIHKPEIDKITIKCQNKKCKGTMRRVEEVLDVWFDSGVSSWAALETDANIKKFWPADLNIEGKDQVRGWWNSQFILSQIKFNRRPFESITEHGMVLDVGKKKMSKSLGNIIAPHDVIEKHSRDYLRYYFAKISKGEDFAFDDGEFNEIKKTMIVFSNINNFINQIETGNKKSKLQIEDKWILSKFNSLVKSTLENYNAYKFPEIIQEFENFLINDLSKTYIKMIRDRSDEVFNVLNDIRIGIIKLLAPIMPFTTEKIWQELKENRLVKEISIHLTTLPKSNEKEINKNLEEKFSIVAKIIESGLRERDKAQIGLKWPLPAVIIYLKNKQDYKEFEEIIKSQLNVKQIRFETPAEKETIFVLELDKQITPELEAEGFAREISRAVQALRKKAGLIKTQHIALEIITESKEKLLDNIEFIKERTSSKKIHLSEIASKDKFTHAEEIKIKGIDFKISIKKI